MQTGIQQLLISSSLVLLVACGGSLLEKKKAELASLKETKVSTEARIAELEKEILKLIPLPFHRKTQTGGYRSFICCTIHSLYRSAGQN